MREIKFRAWDKDENGMRNWENLMSSVYDNEYDTIFNDGDLILMQYTGIKDKNGREIYEEDIVKGEHNSLSVVEWDDCIDTDRYWSKGCGFYWNMSGGDEPAYADEERIEVIGNIYENPELLEEKNV